MASKLILDPANVPSELHSLIPLAEFWGISNDLDRESVVEEASPEQIAEFKNTIDRYEAEFDRWLGGKEAEGPGFSDESIAFSAMRMAADYA